MPTSQFGFLANFARKGGKTLAKMPNENISRTKYAIFILTTDMKSTHRDLCSSLQ
jgi:hypothetical protein